MRDLLDLISESYNFDLELFLLVLMMDFRRVVSLWFGPSVFCAK